MSESDSLSQPNGADAIRAILADLPMQPGVYRMIDAKGDVLYVGKARQLKNRVSSYVSVGRLTTRIMRMVAQVANVEITVTGSEAEALLLEANLIKKHKPRYNILLKDDKSFPYIFIDTSHPYPRITKHRGAQSKKGTYFGPFASAGAVNEALAILQKAFLLRPCADSIFDHRTRPCLQYQIKRCSAPCVKLITESDYKESMTQAAAFLQGKSREVQSALAAQMDAAAHAMEYEKAALLRDRIKTLNKVQQQQSIHSSGLADTDVMAQSRIGDASCVQVMFFRNGSYFGNQFYYPRHAAESEDSEILSAFIGQFYQTHTPPRDILLNQSVQDQELLEKALALQCGQGVAINIPQRGDKFSLVQQAAAAAREALERQLNARRSEQKNLEAVAALFGLAGSPQRIEVYDNSHIMGRHALGAMIAAGPEGFMKSAYRRFNIRSEDLVPGDDYGMMREVLTRRFGRLQKEDPDRTQGLWPDLVLIDGGQGQLSTATAILTELGITGLNYVAIAKGPDRNAGREQFFVPDKQPFTLPPNDPVLHYLQRLRDEAHRFAISSHRVKRAKAISASTLDEVPSIGMARKRALLHHFGSKTEVERASLSELEQVPGISKKVAQLIYDYFHP